MSAMLLAPIVAGSGSELEEELQIVVQKDLGLFSSYSWVLQNAWFIAEILFEKNDMGWPLSLILGLTLC